MLDFTAKFGAKVMLIFWQSSMSIFFQNVLDLNWEICPLCTCYLAGINKNVCAMFPFTWTTMYCYFFVKIHSFAGLCTQRAFISMGHPVVSNWIIISSHPSCPNYVSYSIMIWEEKPVITIPRSFQSSRILHDTYFFSFVTLFYPFLFFKVII